MSHLIRASNSFKLRFKFRPSLGEHDPPQPTSVTVFIRLRDEVHKKNPDFLGILEDKPYKREFERETPQFSYNFVVGAACEERISGDYRYAIIISDCPKTWLELYEKAKASEPKRIGGALSLGGETLDEEMRKTLEEKTGGHLPILLPTNCLNHPWDMASFTLRKAESVLIWQRVSLATRRKQDKRDMRRQVRVENKWTSRSRAAWIRLGGGPAFDFASFKRQFEDKLVIPKFFLDEQLPPRRFSVVMTQTVLLITDCPKKMVEMYNRVKEEWGPRDIDLAMIQCDLSKRERKELESRLGGHLPAYFKNTAKFESRFELNWQIHAVISNFQWSVNYRRMTKAWNLAKIEKKRAEQRSREPIEEDSDADSLISFDSVDELPSDYEENEGKESDNEAEDLDFEKHSCTYCFDPVKANQFFMGLVDAAFGSTYDEYKSAESSETKLDKWLYKRFDEQKTALAAKYEDRYCSEPHGDEMEKLKRKAWDHTKSIFREALGWKDNDEDIEFLMGGLRRMIWKDNMSERKWNEIRAKLDVVPELTETPKKGIKRKKTLHEECREKRKRYDSDSKIVGDEPEHDSDFTSDDSDGEEFDQDSGDDSDFTSDDSDGEEFDQDSGDDSEESDKEEEESREDYEIRHDSDSTLEDDNLENIPDDSDEEYVESSGDDSDDFDDGFSKKLLIESFVEIFGCTYSGQSSEYMEKAIIRCWNWLHRIFNNKQKTLVEEYKKENGDPSTKEAKKEIKRKASEHTEIILRKFRRNESDVQIRGYMEGLHKEISKVESGEAEPYFPQEYLPGQSPSRWSALFDERFWC